MSPTATEILWPVVVAISIIFTVVAVFVLTVYFGQRRHIRSQLEVLSRLRAEVVDRTRAEQRYRGIFQNAVEGIFQISTKGDLITANPALAKIFGFDSPQALMENVRLGFSQPFLPAFRQKRFFATLEEQEVITNYIAIARRSDKKRIWVSANIRAVKDTGQMTLFYEGTLEDISERRKAEQLQRELAGRILEAQETERKRVAFELHDSINQMLSSVRYRLKSAEEKSRGKIRTGWAGAQESRILVEKTIQEIRRISRNLHPTTLEHLGLPAAVRTLGDEFSKRTNIHLQIESSKLTRRLPPNLELALFRIVQEALNNIEKHSHATNAQVRLALSHSSAVAVIKDDGVGFNLVAHNMKKQRGIGLVSMNERASLLGGRVTLDTAPRKGTTVVALIPLNAQNDPKPTRVQT